MFNIGFDDEISILKLAQILHKLENCPFNPVFLPPRPNDPKRRRPDIEKLKSFLPNLKFTELEEGLKTTIEFYKKNIF